MKQVEPEKVDHLLAKPVNNSNNTLRDRPTNKNNEDTNLRRFHDGRNLSGKLKFGWSYLTLLLKRPTIFIGCLFFAIMQVIRVSPTLNELQIKSREAAGGGEQQPQYISSQASTPIPPWRMLMGIFSTESNRDEQRRQAIRDTYLSYDHEFYFKSFWKNNTREENPEENLSLMDKSVMGGEVAGSRKYQHSGRICSLHDILQQQQQQRHSNKEETLNEESWQWREEFANCQIIYTFVMADGRPKDTTMPTEWFVKNDDEVLKHLSPSNNTSFSVENPRKAVKDAIYLPIRDNMNDGKTTSWFSYASRTAEKLEIDLIAKVDADTLVYPGKFIKQSDRMFRERNNTPHPSRVYGGNLEFLTYRAHKYQHGGFYFLSLDIAKFITSDSCNRTAVAREEVKNYGYRAEDSEMGLLVATYENSTSNVEWMHYPKGPTFFHGRMMKNITEFKKLWRRHLKRSGAALRS